MSLELHEVENQNKLLKELLIKVLIAKKSTISNATLTKAFGIKRSTFNKRISNGWSIERALLTSPLDPVDTGRTGGKRNSKKCST